MVKGTGEITLMSATEARKKTAAYNDEWYKRLETKLCNKIGEACSQGSKKTTIQTSELGNYEQINNRINLVLVNLKSAGYDVVRQTRSDCRDNDSWDYLEISW